MEHLVRFEISYKINSISTPLCHLLLEASISTMMSLKVSDYNTQFIYSNRDVYIAIALCNSLLHSAIAIYYMSR
jgi:hypothetical protein